MNIVCNILLFIAKKGCNKYGNLCRNSNSALSAAGKTRLDRERAKMCQNEMVSVLDWILIFYHNNVQHLAVLDTY